MMTEELGFITWDSKWTKTTCPKCKIKNATSHGWVYSTAPPKKPLHDNRKPIHEVYLHEDGSECT